MAKRPKFGIGEVWIDRVNKGTFDLYAASPQYQVEIPFNGLAPGNHTIEIRPMRTKNAGSASTAVVVDGFSGGVQVAPRFMKSPQREAPLEMPSGTSQLNGQENTADSSWWWLVVPILLATLWLIRRVN